jgi:hypothetical protein
VRILNNRRGRLTISFAITAVLFALLRLCWTPPDKPVSFFFDTTGWSWWFDRVWPFDFGWCWLMCWLCLVAIAKAHAMERRATNRLTFTIALMVTSFSSFLAVTRGSWYLGAEMLVSGLVVCMVTINATYIVMRRFATTPAATPLAGPPPQRAITSGPTSYRSPRRQPLPPDRFEPINPRTDPSE